MTRQTDVVTYHRRLNFHSWVDSHSGDILLLFDQVEATNILLTFSKNTLSAEIQRRRIVGTTGVDGKFDNADERLPNGEPGGES